MVSVGLKFRVSSLDPCLSFAYRADCGAAVSPITHNPDVLDCEEPDVSRLASMNSGRRPGYLEAQGNNFARVEMELAQDNDFAVPWTPEEFTEGLSPVPTSPSSWDPRQRLLSMDEVRMSQCGLAGLRR